MNISYNLSHHGGNSTHTLWIKYFTIKCDLKDDDIQLQTPIDQYLISIYNYHPADIRDIKKTIKKSHDQSELEQNLSELFLFKDINYGNVFVFSRFLSEKITSFPNPVNLEMIPQFLIRGLIVFSYNFNDLFEKYFHEDAKQIFQKEYWELIYYPIRYLLKESNELFKETILIISPILSNLKFELIANLENSDFLKIGFNKLILNLIEFAPLEFELGSSHIFDFLLKALKEYSNQDLKFSKDKEIIVLFNHFFKMIPNVTKYLTSNQSEEIFLIFIHMMNLFSKHSVENYLKDKKFTLFAMDDNKQSSANEQITNNKNNENKEENSKERNDNENKNDNKEGNDNDNNNENLEGNDNEENNEEKEENNGNEECHINRNENITVTEKNKEGNTIDHKVVKCLIDFATSTFYCLPAFLPKYTNVVDSILSFLRWITETIPYKNIFYSLGDYPLFSNETRNIKYDDWVNFFNDNILLPEKLTKQIKSKKIKNIIDSLEAFFKGSLPFMSIILDGFSNQISNYIDEKKYLILIFIFISLIKVKSFDTINISSNFLSTNIYETAFPNQLSTPIEPIALHFHEVYLKFLYFFSLGKTENLQAVLKIISQNLSTKNFEKMGHFLPLLRSLLLNDSHIQFIHYFLESRIIENIYSFLFISKNIALIDQIAAFYQLISMIRPLDTFCSPSFLLALRNLVLIDRLHDLLGPCFKNGISLSHMAPVTIGKKCVHETLEQILSILKDVEGNPKIYNFSIELVIYLTESVELIDVSILDDFTALFEEISKLPAFILTSESFLRCLKFFNKLVVHFPKYLKIANSNNSVIIKNFVSSASKIKMTQEIIDCSIAFVLNEETVKETKIKNRGALYLLLQECKNANFEIFVLNYLLKICRNSLFNNFECFSSDVIGFVLNTINDHIDLSLELFKVIGSKFFSPLALNHTFKALRLVNGKRCNHHQKLLDTFLSMLNDCRSSPVTSFFHFGGSGEGIVIDKVNPNFFSEPYSISTYFKIDKFENCLYPIISIIDKGKKLGLLIKKDMLVIQQNEHPGYVLRYNFIQFNWYKLTIIINPACTQIFINDTELSSIPISKQDFRNEVTVSFGIKNQESFYGDFGPTIFIKSTNLQEINEIYQQINLSRIYFKSVFIQFLPWLVKNDIINDVIMVNDSYHFNGDAIPSCTTIAQMILFEGTIPKFLPLFILLNYPISSDKDKINRDENKNNSSEFINENEQFFISILLTFETLFKISEKLQKSFEQIGGFQLFAGFVSHLNPELFTVKIADQLKSTYSVITLKSLKFNMIEHVWLNFNLWYPMSFEFQKNLYSIFDKIWRDNLDFIMTKITGSKLLYYAQCTFSELQKNKRKLMLFDLDKQVDIIPIELTNEQQNQIKQIQWKFLINYIIINPNVSSLIDTLMVLSFHNDFYTQKFASEIIEISLKSNINELLIAFDVLNEYEFFLKIFSNSKDIKLQVNILKCLFLIGVYERKGKIPVKTLEFKRVLLIIIQFIETYVESNENKAYLFKTLFLFLYENYSETAPKPQEISNPEALIPLFALSKYANNEELVKYSLMILNDFAQFPNSILYIFSIDSWPIWSFIFVFHCYDIEKDSHTFSYFFSIFFNYALTNSRIDLVNSFLVFLDLLKMYTNFNFDLIKKELLIHLILFTSQHKLNLDVLTNLLSLSLRFLFIEINFESNKEELSSEFLSNLIIKYQSPSSIEEVKNQNPSFNITFKNINNENHNYLIEILSICSSIIEVNYEAQIEFDGILLNVFDLFSYFYSILDESSNVVTKVRAQSFFAKVSSSVSPDVLDKYTSFSRETFVKSLQNHDILKECYHSQLVNETIKISNSIQKMILNSEELDFISKYNNGLEESFRVFIKVYSNSALLSSLYNEKMIISFIRFVTGTNGPWSTLNLSKSEINHWRVSTKIDDNGHNIYWKLNRDFDDHKKASALRDQMNFDANDEPKVELIPNFHRILIQKTSHTVLNKSVTQQDKTNSFKVTLFTLLYHINGNLYIIDRHIFFDGTTFIENLGETNNSIKDRPHKLIEIPLRKISFIFQRRHQHCEIGAEVFTTSNKSYLFIFDSKDRRNEFLEVMKKMTLFKTTQARSFFSPFQNACGSCSQTISCQELVIKSKITKLWQERKISNFTYLIYLNFISGRSFNDISQYPVYPWILSDYKSDKIDLNNPKIYRDLSKPIGTFNAERLAALEKNMDVDDPYQRCLYRTFFSNPSTVAGYLIRTEPFATLHIRLQGQKFDLSTRLFTSIEKAWDSVTGLLNDFRELIPEFFCSEHFLMNENGYDLGKKVNDVQLPKWAKTPHEFISINKMALESDYVSSHLEKWIDLIFGINQYSVENNNIFHLFSYSDRLPPEIINDPDAFFVTQNHALNFGVCPMKLFKEAHQPRNIHPPFFNFNVPHSNSNNSINLLTKTSSNSQAKPSILSGVQYLDRSKRDNSLDFNRLSYDLPFLDDSIACVRKGCVLTTKPTLYNVQQKTVQNLYGDHEIKEGNLIDFDNSYLYEVSRGGTYVSVINIKTSEEVGILPHNNYEITCISCVENHTVLVCGTDCEIDIWRVDSSFDATNINPIIFLGTISSHSMPITAVVANACLDIVISIDEGSNVVISTLRERKFVHTFKIECPSNSVHFLKLLMSGLIVLSTKTPGEVTSNIIFFDLCGNILNKIQMQASVEAIEVINTDDFQEFLVVSSSKKFISVFQCSDFKMIYNTSFQIVPHFISYINKNQRAILVVKVQQKRQFLSVLEF